MRILGLDVGSRTVGVAVSDVFGWTAQSLEVIKIHEEKQNFGFDRLSELLKEYKIKKVVIGLPKNMNNTIGPRVKSSLLYGKMVKERFNLPVLYQDERLTTVQAKRMLIEKADTSRKKQKKVIDKLAASLILQNYLDKMYIYREEV
ncbi:MAG: Holliday junction resolvase RuvX [Streptococcaceae bacterium]|jgi:putative Holliday junction resolvase|nr:Holliday junction resolvase RuvX [Streptococcaceae bacterium]